MMKKSNKIFRALSVALILMLVCNSFALLSFANEAEAETTVEEFTSDDDLQEQIEPDGNLTIEAGEQNTITEAESSSSGFSKTSVSNGIYYIQNIGTSRYIDIHGPNTDMIHQWSYSVGLQSTWEITKLDDGYYTIKSLYNNKYVGIANTSVGVNNINLYSSVNNQTKWIILKNEAGQYAFVPYNNTSYMLCAPNSAIGTELQLTDTDMTNNYNKWTFIEQIQNTNTNLLQNIETRRFASPYGPYFDDGTRIHQWNFSTATQRKWIFERQSDYFFTIKNQYTGKYIGVAEDEDGTIYIEQFSSIADCTKWKIYKSSSGNFIITPKGYEPYSYSISVDPSYNNVGSILKLVAYTNDSNYKDEWKFIEALTYLGSLTTTWYSDSSSVGYWDLDGTSKSINVYAEKRDTDASFYFYSGINEAILQWENLLTITLDTVYDEASANIKVYGGTRDQMVALSGYSGNGWTGLAVASPFPQGIMNLNGGNEVITIIKISSAKIYIISRDNNEDSVRSTNSVRKTIVHEFGHSLGYAGHAPDSNDVMYAGGHESYTLKTMESNHLKVIYTLYNQ